MYENAKHAEALASLSLQLREAVRQFQTEYPDVRPDDIASVLFGVACRGLVDVGLDPGAAWEEIRRQVFRRLSDAPS